MIWKLGCFFGLSGVMTGAFGAHGLKSILANDPEALKKLDNWKTGAYYQLIHSLCILAAKDKPVAAYLMILGIIGFSGTLYAFALVDDAKIRRILGPITPLGGLCFIAGWFALAWE